jgi:hypothetical protein
VRLLSGKPDVTHVIVIPIVTVQMLMQVGSTIAGTGVNGGNDPFHGYIACARVEGDVLTPENILANYTLEPLGTVAPTAPAGLTAMGSDGQATLTWNASSSAASYIVKRSSVAGGLYSVVATNLTILSFTNTGLTKETTYYFVVSAVNVADESDNSPPVSVQPVSLSIPQLNLAAGNNQIRIA